MGFEPTEPFGSPVFKTGAIDHSTTPPVCAGAGGICLQGVGDSSKTLNEGPGRGRLLEADATEEPRRGGAGGFGIPKGEGLGLRDTPVGGPGLAGKIDGAFEEVVARLGGFHADGKKSREPVSDSEVERVTEVAFADGLVIRTRSRIKSIALLVADCSRKAEVREQKGVALPGGGGEVGPSGDPPRRGKVGGCERRKSKSPR